MDFSPYYYPNGRKRGRRKRIEEVNGPLPRGLLFKFPSMSAAQEFASTFRYSTRARVYTNSAQ